uniref:Uncharacterized protein n=1 Tax=Arundo donax TaxID=35708 RepID=A0A0A9DAH3_ARUDO
MGMACHDNWNFCTHSGIVAYTCDLDILLHHQNQDGRTCCKAAASYCCNCDFSSMANSWHCGKHPCWFGLWISSTSNDHI